MNPYALKLEVAGMGICKEIERVHGVSKKSGKEYDFYSVRFTFLGDTLKVTIKKDELGTMEIGKAYQISGEIGMGGNEGFELTLSNTKFVEVKEEKGSGKNKQE